MAYKAAKTFAEGQATHPFLTLGGPVGTGKTHLEVAIARTWIETDRGMAFYYQVGRLLNQLRRGYGREDKDDVYSLLDTIETTSLLALDDLGVQRPSEWATEMLDEIINERYQHGRYTVITTNRPPEEHSPRIRDRLREGVCVMIDANLKSMRESDEH